MDKELIQRLAREAGFSAEDGQLACFDGWCTEELHSFATLIAEECAKVAEPGDGFFPGDGYFHGRQDSAAAIREKFKP